MMQYLAYIAVATPLLLAWLFWASATAVPPAGAPLFHPFDEDLHQASVLKERAIADLSAAQTTSGGAFSSASTHANKAR